MTKNLISNYLGSAVLATAQIVAIPFYIQFLDPEGWGVVSAVLSWAAAALVIEAGCTLSISRHVAMLGNLVGELNHYIRSMEIRYLSAAGLCLSAAAVLLFLVRGPGVSLGASGTHVEMASLAFIFAAAQVSGAVYRGVLVGIGAQPQINVLMGGFAILRHGMAVLCAWKFALVGTVVIAMALCMALEAIARRFVAYRVIGKRNSIADIPAPVPNTGWPVALLVASVIGGALPIVDRTLLTARLAPADFGAYAVASMLSISLLQLIYPVSQALIPRLSEFSVRNARTGLDRLSIVLFIGVVATSLLFVWTGKPALRWWLSDADLAATVFPLLAVHLVGTGVNAMCVPQHVKLLAERKDSLILLVNVGAFGAQVVVLAALVSKLGSLAGAFSWIAANTVLFTGYWIARRR